MKTIIIITKNNGEGNWNAIKATIVEQLGIMHSERDIIAKNVLGYNKSFTKEEKQLLQNSVQELCYDEEEVITLVFIECDDELCNSSPKEDITYLSAKAYAE